MNKERFLRRGTNLPGAQRTVSQRTGLKHLAGVSKSARALRLEGVRFVAATALFAVLSPAALLAQGSNGTIEGTVKDQTGAVIAGATITIRNTDTGVSRIVTTEGSGHFEVPALVAGNYEVKTEHTGFKTTTQQGIVLTVSQDEVLNFVMSLGTTSEVVEVKASQAVINTTDNSIAGLVGEHAIQDLPLNGRNYVDLALMQPGTDQDYAVGGTGGAGASSFSTHGNTVWSNLFTLDGAILNNALQLNSASQTGTTLGLDGIQEFKIVGLPDASYGLVMGGQVVMASKGGTNQFHGDIFEYFRNAALDARNFFDLGYLSGGRRIPNFVRNQFGATVGGPIRKDKTFFWAVYESLRSATGSSVLDNVPAAGCHGGAGQTITPAACPSLSSNTVIAPQIAPLLAIFPTPNIGTTQYTFPASSYVNENYGQMRVDHTLSAQDSLFVRYTIDTGAINNNTSFPLYRQTLPGTNQFFTLGETHIFNPNVLNSLRLSVSRTTQNVNNVYTSNNFDSSQYSFIAGLPMGNAQITGLTTLGAQSTKPSLDNLTLYNLTDDIAWNRGHHTLRFGTLLNLYRQAAGTNGNATGTLSFPSLQSFMQGTIANGTVLTLPAGVAPNATAPNVNRYFGYSTYGFYVQDDWRALPRLTLNLGLRYEPMDTINELNGNGYAMVNLATATGPTKGPIFDNPTKKNFSPRVGFAWDVFGDGKSSLRGGFGVYRDVGNIGSELREQLQGTPPYAITTVSAYTLQPTDALTAFLQQPGTIGKSLQIVGYNARAPYSLSYNLTAERQVLGMAVSATYVGLHGIHLWTRGEGNPVLPAGYESNGKPYYATYTNAKGVGTQPPCELSGTTVNGVTTFCRVNPLYSTVTLDQTAATSSYNSLEINIVRPVGHGVEFQTSYTWSKAMDDTEDMGGFEQGASGCGTNSDPLDRRADWGPACFDATNKWNANMIYHLPNAAGEHFASVLTNGWYLSNIVTVQSGVPFTPIMAQNRSNSGVFIQSAYDDHLNFNTAASIAANPCTSQPGQPAAGSNPCAYTPIPYDKKTVATHKPGQWFNPAMFSLPTVGHFGSVGRDTLRSPYLLVWNASAVKDTPVHFLGDKGNMEFRAELFNPLNKANLGLPAGTAFNGYQYDAGPYSEAPLSTAGQITATLTSSRQIQFAVKLQF